MFRNVFRSSAARITLAGAAAAMTGSAYLSSRDGNPAECDKKEETATTVVGLLQGINASVRRMEDTLGTSNQSSNAAARHGIDVVLGAQWGDEGKGKLVDMLSQVSIGRRGKTTASCPPMPSYTFLRFFFTGIRRMRPCCRRIECWTHHCG